MKHENLPQKGFTILDLLAILVALGFVGFLVWPQIIPRKKQGTLTACKSNLKNIGTALEMYSTDWSGHYPLSLKPLTPLYLRAIPKCVEANENTYSPTYKSFQHPTLEVHCPDHRAKYINDDTPSTRECLALRERLLAHLEELRNQETEFNILLRRDLKCPDGKTIQIITQLESYSFYCGGHHHKNVNVPKNYPRYDGMEGLIERPRLVEPQAPKTESP